VNALNHLSANLLRSLASLNEIVKPILPIILGILVLYAPTVQHLFQTVWTAQDQAHGPMILFVVLYLFWTKKSEIKLTHGKSNALLGWSTLLFGLCVYIIGHSQDMIAFDVGSSLFVVIGILLIRGGLPLLKVCWFPIFFLLFMIPLPGALLDAITAPMKMAVSYVAEHVLYLFHYPVARSGVIIQIGQYKLFVADACAGMHTLLSLEALGLFYLSFVKHDSLARNLSLGLLIIPISFIANVIRVITLILVTYYYGDEVAQGFIHTFASVFLFAVALILIVSIDSAIQRIVLLKT